MIRRTFLQTFSLLTIITFFDWSRLFKKKKVSKEIIAIQFDDTIQLHWENPIPIMDAGPPKTWTWKDFMIEAYGETEESLTDEYLEHQWEMISTQLDDKVPQEKVDEWWFEHGVCTTNEVFYYLQTICLSDHLNDQLLWYEYPSMGSSYVGVEAKDVETLILLEKELNEQDEDVKFRLIKDWNE